MRVNGVVAACCVLCVVLSLSASAQEPVEINLEEVKQVLSSPRIVGSTSCPSQGRLRVSLTGGNEGNSYEVFEFDPSNPSVPIKNLGMFPVTIDLTGITFGEIALNGPAPLIGAVQLEPGGEFQRVFGSISGRGPGEPHQGWRAAIPRLRVWPCNVLGGPPTGRRARALWD